MQEMNELFLEAVCDCVSHGAYVACRVNQAEYEEIQSYDVPFC